MDEALFEVQEDHLEESLANKENLDKVLETFRTSSQDQSKDELAKMLYDSCKKHKGHYRQDILDAIEKYGDEQEDTGPEMVDLEL